MLVCGIFARQYGVEIGVLGKGASRIVHNTVVVVFEAKRIHFFFGELVKVILLTLRDETIGRKKADRVTHHP